MELEEVRTVAQRMMTEGSTVTSEQAKDYGLVNRVIARERLVEETLEYAADVAANDPPGEWLIRVRELASGLAAERPRSRSRRRW